MAGRVRRPYFESTDHLEIDGESVKMVTRTVNRVVTLSDFITALGNQSGISTPILPNGCKFFRQRGPQTILVIEKAPETRHVKWINMNPERSKINWKLAFPYTIYILEYRNQAFNSTRIYYRNTPLTSLEDMLFSTNLCNVYSQGTICTGELSINVDGSSIMESADNFIAGFWQSTFNADLKNQNFDVDAGRVPTLASLEKWQASTKADPLFTLSTEWRAFSTLGTLLNDIT